MGSHMVGDDFGGEPAGVVSREVGGGGVVLHHARQVEVSNLHRPPAPSPQLRPPHPQYLTVLVLAPPFINLQ